MLTKKQIKIMLAPVVLKIHSGINREQSRKKYRVRVRNNSISTCHPKQFKFLTNLNFTKREVGIEKNMSNSYRELEAEIQQGKGLGFIRNLLNNKKANV